MHTYTHANSISDGFYNKSTFNIVCILIEILSHTHAKGWEVGSLNNFKSGIFIGRFQSDGVGSMAVKG